MDIINWRCGKKCSLLLLFLCLISQQSKCAEAASEDEYQMLLENQGYLNDASNPRSKFISHINQLLEQQEEDKRSSSFFPLRGKKFPDSDPNNPDHYQYSSNQEDKRSQFFPLRGKKVPSDLKRASYFMPMRGRKDDDWNTAGEEEEVDDSLDKRASSFMPMRGKKQSGGIQNAFQPFGKSGTYSSVKTEQSAPFSSDNSMISDKRMSFTPTRGRKADSQADTNNSIVSMDKNKTQSERLRNKRSSGSFTPMRGRRLLSFSDEQLQDSGSPGAIVTSMLEKKQYAFMPMRGRRFSYYALKRPMSFFATRGKRMDESSN